MLILLLAFSINKTYAQTNVNVYQNPGAASAVQTATALTPEQQAALQTQQAIQASEKKFDVSVLKKEIELRNALVKGLSKNAAEQVRNFTRHKLDLGWKDTYEKFWFPNIKLSMASGGHSLNNFRNSTNENSALTGQTPELTLGLELGSYTVFNWGIDFLGYQNDEATYKRNKQVQLEKRRKLRFAIISQYFNLIRTLSIERARKDQLRHNSFVHRLAKQRLGLNKIRKQEYYLTKSEFLRSQTHFQEAQYQSSIENESLAHLLGDSLRTTYLPREELKFSTINTSQEESLRLAISQSPTYRDAKLNFKNANRTYKQTVKKQLPLPKIDLNLGAYEVGYNGTTGRNTTYKTTTYSDGSYNSNIELVATINMTWTIFGEKGFLNSRENKRAYLNKKISEINYNDAKRNVDVRVRTLYRNIRYLERKSKVTEEQLKNSRKSFDFTLDAYINKKAKYADLKIALDNMISSRIEFENSKYVHLTQKLTLSDLMGLDDFPGSNFENLAVK